MQFHGLSPFGVGTFDNAPTPSQTAYSAILAAYGPLGDRDLTTYYGSRHLAKAILVGVVRRHIQRAACQLHPLSVKDKLPSQEKDWGIIPPPTADLNQRQLALAAQQLLMTGAKQVAIDAALVALLGASYYGLRVTTAAQRRVMPTDPSTVGSFQAPGVAPKLVQLLDSSFLGAQTIPYALVGDSTAPIVGERWTLDPADVARAEAVTITAVGVDPLGRPTISYVGLKPHNPNVYAATCKPLWRSNQRHVAVLVKNGVVTPEIHRQINAIMQRHMKSVTDWSVCESTPAGLTGPWIVNRAIIGLTALGDVAG